MTCTARRWIALWILVILQVQGCPYHDPQHTLCQYRASACTGKTLLRSGGLGCTEKQLILDVHNQLRQNVALGHVTGQPPAAGMREMVWDEELATVAQRWADQCRMGHDASRTVARFPVGQNVAMTWTFENPSPAGPDPEFRRQIEAWFGEVMQWGLRRSDVEHFHFSERTGHYTQLVWSDTYLVGCGYSYFKDPQRGYTKLYVCNYGPGGNVIGEHLYEPGQPTCATNDLSTSRRYTGLCEVRGSNPPGMFCSAHDALHATHGAYALSPTVPQRPQQSFYQQPFQQTPVQAFHPTVQPYHQPFRQNTPSYHQNSVYQPFHQTAVQPFRPNAVQPYRSQSPFQNALNQIPSLPRRPLQQAFYAATNAFTNTFYGGK